MPRTFAPLSLPYASVPALCLVFVFSTDFLSFAKRLTPVSLPRMHSWTCRTRTTSSPPPCSRRYGTLPDFVSQRCSHHFACRPAPRQMRYPLPIVHPPTLAHSVLRGPGPQRPHPLPHFRAAGTSLTSPSCFFSLLPIAFSVFFLFSSFPARYSPYVDQFSYWLVHNSPFPYPIPPSPHAT